MFVKPLLVAITLGCLAGSASFTATSSAHEVVTETNTTTPSSWPLNPAGFPKKAYNSTNIEGGTMQTTVTVGENGNITVTTRTFTKVKLKGFTGGVYAVLFTDNGDGKVSPIKTYGVDGVWGGRSDRTETFQFSVPPDFAKRVTHIAIVQQHAPRYSDLLDAVVKGSKRFADSFGQIKSNLAPYVKAV